MSLTLETRILRELSVGDRDAFQDGRLEIDVGALAGEPLRG